MTHHTDAERAQFEEWRIDEIRKHLPTQDNGDDYIRGVFLRWSKKHQIYQPHSEQIRWEAWKASRRAPAAPVPQEPTRKQVVFGAGALLGQPENTADNRHPDWSSAVAKARSVYLAMLAAAPQPQEAAQSNSAEFDGIEKEAAPVQLPEPSAWMFGCKTGGGGVSWKLSWSKPGAGVCHRLSGEEFEQPLYTEQQVRELLEAHGIGKDGK